MADEYYNVTVGDAPMVHLALGPQVLASCGRQMEQNGDMKEVVILVPQPVEDQVVAYSDC